MKTQIKMLQHIDYISTSSLEVTQRLCTVISQEKYLVGDITTKWSCSHQQKYNTKEGDITMYYIDPLLMENYTNYQFGNDLTLRKLDSGDWKAVFSSYKCDNMHGERESLDFTITAVISRHAMIKYFPTYIKSAFYRKVSELFQEEEDARILAAMDRIGNELLKGRTS